MADIQSNIKFNIDTSDAMASIKALQNQISAFQTQMAKGSAANAREAKNLQRTLIDNINATNKFAASVTSIKTTTESFTSSLEKNKLSLREYFRYAGGASKSFGKLFTKEFETINKVARERVKDLQTQYIQLGRDANGAMQAIKIRPLILDMDNLATKTAIAAQRQQLLNQLLKQGSTNLLNFGKNTQWAGRQLMVGFTIPLGILGQTAVKTFMDMETQAIKFKRVYGDLFTTTQETNKALKDIRGLATEFTKYGVAASKTMELAAQAAATGKTGAELLAQVNQANRLAVLGNVEQQQALETTMSLTNAFGVSADKLAQKINFLNAVENQTVTSIEDLTTAIPKAGPVIKQLGGNVEDLAFFLTAMREGGINASEGANALKSGLAALINPTTKASDMLAGFGINIKKIVEANKGNVKGLVLDFANALDTLDPLNRARAIEQLFGKFQFSRLSTLFQNVVREGSQASRVLELTAASSTQLAILANSELKKLSESPMYKFQKAVEDIKVQLAPVGEEFLKAITPIIQFGTDVLKAFNNLDGGVKQFIVNLTGIVGGIGPILLMTFGLIANGAANIIKLFALMKSGFNNLGRTSTDLASQTQYLTDEQIQASAVAASLDQVHSKLRQTFTLEASALDQLTAAYQRNILASGIRPGMPAKRFADGGMVTGPGTGTSDSIPAMVSNGEFIVNAKRTKQYLPLLQNIAAGKVPGFKSPDGGSLVDFKGYTNAVHLVSKAGNADIINPQNMASELRLGQGKAFAPIVHEIARQLGGASQAEIENIIRKNPHLIDMATKTNNAIADELATSVGNMDQKQYSQIWQKHLRKQAESLSKIEQEALEKVLTEVTTVEDRLHLRQRGKGTIEPRGRTGIIAGTPSYRDQLPAYLRTAEMFPGGQLGGTTLAHGTIPQYGTLEQLAAGRRLSGNGRGIEKLAKTGMISLGLRGRPGESVLISIAELEQIKAEVGGTLTAAAQKILQEVKDGIREVTKISSPSKEAYDIGVNTGQGYLDGSQSKVDDAKAAGQEIANAAVNGIQTGGKSGKARRAISQDPSLIGKTQTGGSRKHPRVQTGPLIYVDELGQYVDENTLPSTVSSGGQAAASSGGQSKPTGKLRGMKRAKAIYRGLKSGFVKPGLTYQRAGFGVGAVAGTAAMFAPPEMQGTLGLVSTIATFGGMFSKTLERLTPVLARVVPILGALAAAAFIAKGVFDALTEETRKRIEQEKRIASATKIRGNTASLENFFGVTVSDKYFKAPTSLGFKGTSEQQTATQQLRADEAFKSQYKTTISALKNATEADAKFILKNLALGLSPDFAPEQINVIMEAIKQEAGRTNLTIDFASIDLTSKVGIDNAIGLVRDAANKVKITSDTFLVPDEEIQRRLSSQIQLIASYREKLAQAQANNNTEDIALYEELIKRTTESYNANLSTETQAVTQTFVNVAQNSVAALTDAFSKNKITAEEFASAMQRIQDKFNALNPTASRIAIEEWLQTTSYASDTRALIQNLNNLSDQWLVLAASVAHANEAQLLAKELNDIETGVTKGSADMLERRIKTIREKLTKLFTEPIDSGTDGSVLTPIDKQLEKMQGSVDKLKLGLDIINLLEKNINKKYDARIKKFEELKKLNEDISNQQKDQLDLADALSRGDIFGAAKAAQQMQANDAQRAIDAQTKALELARQQELAGLTDPSGLTKAQLESRIAKLELLIAQRKYKTGAATGGYISGPGSGTSDSIPAMLSNGEYVIRAKAAQALGIDVLDRLNHAEKFADGGPAIDPNNPISILGSGLSAVMDAIYQNLFGGWANNLRHGKPTMPTKEDALMLAMGAMPLPGGKAAKAAFAGKSLFEAAPKVVSGEKIIQRMFGKINKSKIASGQFPYVRATDVEAHLASEYGMVYEHIAKTNPGILKANGINSKADFMNKLDSFKAGSYTKAASSVSEIDPLNKLINETYASKILGMGENGLIKFYRNASSSYQSKADAAMGYASLDKRMAYNFNPVGGGANSGRYTILAKPGEIKGLIGYSGNNLLDEFAAVIGKDVASMPGRSARVGGLRGTSNFASGELGGASRLRNFMAEGQFNLSLLKNNPGASMGTLDMLTAKGKTVDDLIATYEKIWGKGSWSQRTSKMSTDFASYFSPSRNKEGMWAFNISKFAKYNGEWALNPEKVDELKSIHALQKTLGVNWFSPRGLPGFKNGGMVIGYADGGFAMGTDTVPAMLTPGEFVIKKSAVDRIGVNNLNKINGYANGGEVKTGNSSVNPMYNSYSINLSVSSNSDADAIANKVMDAIRRVESQNIRSNRF